MPLGACPFPLPLCRPVQGWDKTYCLRYVEADFDEIHFFGDKTFQVDGVGRGGGCWPGGRRLAGGELLCGWLAVGVGQLAATRLLAGSSDWVACMTGRAG